MKINYKMIIYGYKLLYSQAFVSEIALLLMETCISKVQIGAD